MCTAFSDTFMRKRPDIALDPDLTALPLRREVGAVLGVLKASGRPIKTGLDIGFTNAGVSQLLRQSGGYWMTVEPTPERSALVATVLGTERVLCAGEAGELPFEDKQFDVVVMAHGTLPEGPLAAEMIRECHRVLNAGGLFVFTVETRMPLGLAAVLNSRRVVSGAGGCYTESGVFQLLKDGFDVLGFRYACRFWVQLVRQWADRRRGAGNPRGMSNGWLRMLYAVARVLDGFLFWTRGHQMTVHARRKGWREKQSRITGMGTPVSDAILCDPRRGGRQTSLGKFK